VDDERSDGSVELGPDVLGEVRELDEVPVGLLAEVE
jgi:hypothetical protein